MRQVNLEEQGGSALAFPWARSGVVTLDDLAEQSVDELTEMTDLDAEKAASLFMKARDPWFADAETD